MRHKHWLLIAVLLLTVCIAAYGQAQTSTPDEVNLLRNSDVVRLVEDGVKPGQIIATILTSHCNFDVFPPVLRELKRRGVPQLVLMAMKQAPNGPPLLDVGSKSKAVTARVRIPEGTVVEVETSRPISSANVSVGSAITFLVARRVFIDNVLVLDWGAVARARVVKVRRAAAWGRAGMLAWEMEYVVAVDGTRIPIQVSGESKGNNRSFAVAGGAIATGALIFPYTSPVGLIWGLKKGDEAVLRGSRSFKAVVRTNSDVGGIPPRQNRVIFHNMDTVKASSTPSAPAQLERLQVRH